MADAITGTGVWSVTTWPWPQVFYLSYYTLFFAVKTGTTNLYLYEAYCSTSNVWAATEIQNLGAVANVKYVTVADFNMFYVVTTYAEVGNVVTVDAWMKDVGADTVTALPSTNSPVYACITNFNGQPVAGGIAHGDDTSFGNMALNTVAWSEVGKFDFREGEVEVTPGGPKRFNRTSGYRHMEWGEWGRGKVYRVGKLGNSVIVYGDGGIARLLPISAPVSTYSKQDVAGYGLKCGSAMDGDESIHGFINEDDEMCLLTESGELRVLGYQEYLDDLTGIIKVSYCAARKRFYISDGIVGYVLTPHGMYSTDQYVTSVGSYRGVLSGFVLEGSDQEMRITTNTLDFGIRAMKTISSVEVGINYYTGTATDVFTGTLQYRNDYHSNRDSFSTLDYVTINPKGNFVQEVTANEFRVRLKGTTYVDAKLNLDYITTRIKLSDKTSIRGIYGQMK